MSAPDPAEVRAREVLFQHTDAFEGHVRIEEAIRAMLAFASATEAPPVAGGSVGEVLKPFADLADWIDKNRPKYANPAMEVQIEGWPYTLSVEWLYAARTARKAMPVCQICHGTGERPVLRNDGVNDYVPCGHPKPTHPEAPADLLAHLKRIPMTEWVWADAEMIFATLDACSTCLYRDAIVGISDDYMTSECHHPGHVLIPAKRFDILVEAEKRLGAEPVFQENGNG